MTKAIVHADGYCAHNIWCHSSIVAHLYRQRARDAVEEMTCAAQAADLLKVHISPRDSVLDAGCGSGYFFHSLRRRGLDVLYHGFDSSACLIRIGHDELPVFGLPRERLSVLRIEDFQGKADHVVCMNVLSNIDNYHRPLERLLEAARKTIIIRESIHGEGTYAYVRDDYLDPGVNLKVYVNTYPRKEIIAFIESYGFEVSEVVDMRTAGVPETVIGYPHHWTFLVGTKTQLPKS